MSSKMWRQDNRAYDQLRKVKVTYNSFGYAPGNVLFEIGNTKVLCSVMMQKGVPPFLKGSKTGWLTAEYALLPAATTIRTQREATLFKRNSRSVEISRLIGRSLRSIVQLDNIGEQTIMVDCDVLQADGGTRTACLTGAYLALEVAEQFWREKDIIPETIIKDALAAISVGVIDNQVYLDLDYSEDNRADADFNFVLTSLGKLIEVQGSAEKKALSWEVFEQLRQLACSGIAKLMCYSKRLATGKNRGKGGLFSLQRRELSK
jgi:ribonuclease PH